MYSQAAYFKQKTVLDNIKALTESSVLDEYRLVFSCMQHVMESAPAL